ncbi:MAG TPA: hypothetical protein O0X27_03675 [Methanocorpusculum sp.]|nr:hypothetical protein [Methanocorpusculum sp.]
MASDLESRISRLEDENAALKQRVADLELQMAQVTERALRMSSSCSTCGH